MITEGPKCPMNLSRDLLGGKLEQLAELGSDPVGPRGGKKFGDTSAARILARFYYCLSGLFGPRFFFLNIASYFFLRRERDVRLFSKLCFSDLMFSRHEPTPQIVIRPVAIFPVVNWKSTQSRVITEFSTPTTEPPVSNDSLVRK